MRSRLAVACLLGLGVAWTRPARACGFGEAPVSCGEDAEGGARYMLKRVVAAVGADEAKALGEFSRGEAGFRTVDTYVFCVGPTGVMTAHPSPALQGTDVRDLHDKTGNHFIATMLDTAKPGEVSKIRYLFVRPGGTVETPKTTYYTRAGDQVCGVGVYQGDETAVAASTPEARIVELRRKLNAELPADARGDWVAFLAALDEHGALQDATFAKAHEQVHAADALLAGVSAPASEPQ